MRFLILKAVVESKEKANYSNGASELQCVTHTVVLNDKENDLGEIPPSSEERTCVIEDRKETIRIKGSGIVKCLQEKSSQIENPTQESSNCFLTSMPPRDMNWPREISSSI